MRRGGVERPACSTPFSVSARSRSAFGKDASAASDGPATRDTLDGVDVVVGNSTAVISGEGLIATPGAIDTHVHLMSPRIMEAALSSGVTTIIGQEFGPVWGVGVNSPWGLRNAFAAFDEWPVNIGFLGRGSSSGDAPLREAIELGGVCGFKVHEDTGAHARALDTALRVADEYDVQVALHTDGLNESLSVDDTLSVLDGRTIHAFHVEGCGGGHVPNVLQLAGVPTRDRVVDEPDAPLRPGRHPRASRHDHRQPRPQTRPTWRSYRWRRIGSAGPPWGQRTSCTISASSRSLPPTRRAWDAPVRPSSARSRWQRRTSAHGGHSPTATTDKPTTPGSCGTSPS